MLDLMCYISDITLFLYQLAQACPHNVLHFLVKNHKWETSISIYMRIGLVKVIINIPGHQVDIWERDNNDKQTLEGKVAIN